MAKLIALVTGGTGFVGSATVKALAEKHPDWSITVLDIQTPKSAAEAQPHVAYVRADVTSLEHVTDIFLRVKPRLIIHTAGIVPVLSERYHRRLADLTHNINVNGTKNVLAAAQKAGVEAFVYTSSCCAVTDNMDLPYANINEDWPTWKTRSSIYGESKAEAESIVLSASDEKLATCVLRPSVLCGPGDYQLVPSIHACIAKRETPFIVGDGDNLWDVTYVTNIADAHVLAAENLLSSRTAAGEAFFIQNNEPISFRDFSLAVWAHFGHVPPFEVCIPQNLAWALGFFAECSSWLTGTPTTLTRGSVRDACSLRYASGDKAKRVLGYEPRIGIEEGIRLSCEDYAQRLRRKGNDAAPRKENGIFPLAPTG